MITCKICIAKYGFSLKDKGRIFETDDDLAEHMENMHGIPVVREDETEEDAIKRCVDKGIVSDRNKCMCQECQNLRQLIEVKNDR